MIPVKVEVTATILVGHKRFEVPLSFETEVENTDPTLQNHEVYFKLKDAALGFNGDYKLTVLT